MSPELLRLHSIPVVKVTQYPGEFIINYPGGGCALVLLRRVPSDRIVRFGGYVAVHDACLAHACPLQSGRWS